MKRKRCEVKSEEKKANNTKKLLNQKVELTEVKRILKIRYALGSYGKNATKKSPDTNSLPKKLPNECQLQEDPSSKWIIVELAENTSLSEHYEEVGHSIKNMLGSDTRFFIPVYNESVQGKNACFVLCEGYVFIYRTNEVVRNIFKLKNEYIKGALFIDGCLRLVLGERINKFKKEMLEKISSLIPEKGQKVIPKVGVFKNLEGEVLSIDKKKLIALVRFEKSSRIVDAPINIVNLTFLNP